MHVHPVLGSAAAAAQLAAVAADVAVLPMQHLVVCPPAETLAAVAVAIAAAPPPPPLTLTADVLGDEARLPPPVREQERVGVVQRGLAVVPAPVVHVQGQVARGPEGVRPPIQLGVPAAAVAAEGGADVGYAIHGRHVRAADLRVEGLECSHLGIEGLHHLLGRLLRRLSRGGGDGDADRWDHVREG